MFKSANKNIQKKTS